MYGGNGTADDGKPAHSNHHLHHNAGGGRSQRHHAAPHVPHKRWMTLVRAAQRAVAPAWTTCFGCNFRDTELLLRQAFGAQAAAAEATTTGGEEQQPAARFEVKVERFWASNVPMFMQFVAPHIRGVVTRVVA